MNEQRINTNVIEDKKIWHCIITPDISKNMTLPGEQSLLILKIVKCEIQNIRTRTLTVSNGTIQMSPDRITINVLGQTTDIRQPRDLLKEELIKKYLLTCSMKSEN